MITNNCKLAGDEIATVDSLPKKSRIGKEKKNNLITS
jgi:hypothetical protein